MSHKPSTKHAKSGTVPSGPKMPSPKSLQEQIRQNAYELYQSRGSQDGFAEQDWLDAERQILPTRT